MKGLLKFITCGSVDDGKSTLIGHILYDAKLLYADQEKALELDSKVGSRSGKIDYSLLLDGLMAEREQGITIDVAYRYFTTDNRSFIVADTPGHEEYTRNMAVGASFAQLAIVMVDAKQGVLVQTRRHSRICSLMGIRHFVFAVNKMDLVGYSEERFKEIEKDIVNEQKNRLNNRICSDLICPMNALQIVLYEIKRSSTRDTIPTKEFIINVKGDANRRQMVKITEYAKELELLSKNNMTEQDVIIYSERFEEMLADLSSSLSLEWQMACKWHWHPTHLP